MPSPDILILRDPRESTKKCTLTPLRGLPDIELRTYASDRRMEADGRILLTTDGELLSPADGGRGLLLIDCSWRRVRQLRATVDGDLVPRRLPPLTSAYPRRSKDFEDPAEGLASVEALHAALTLLGRPRQDLLATYRWREEFLAANPSLGQ
jgi:pre-rRNA-processing protein TSR3